MWVLDSMRAWAVAEAGERVLVLAVAQIVYQNADCGTTAEDYLNNLEPEIDPCLGVPAYAARLAGISPVPADPATDDVPDSPEARQ